MAISLPQIYISADPVNQTGVSSVTTDSKILSANADAVYFLVSYRWTTNATQQVASFTFNGSPITASKIDGGRTGGGGFFQEIWKCTSPPAGTGGAFVVNFTNNVSAPQVLAYVVAGVDFVLGDTGLVQGSFDGGDNATLIFTPQFSNSLLLVVGATGDAARSPITSITEGWTVDNDGTIPHGNPAAGAATYWVHKIGSQAGIEETLSIDLTPQPTTGSGRLVLVEVVAQETTEAEGTATITGGGTITAIGKVGNYAKLDGGGAISALGEKGAESFLTLSGSGEISVVASKPQAGDPHYDNVTFLCHFEGSDGATTAIDSSNQGHTLTFEGSAALETDGALVGTASLHTTGTGNQVRVENSAAAAQFGAEPFTVEVTAEWDGSLFGGRAIIVGQDIFDDRGWSLEIEESSGNYYFQFMTAMAGGSTKVNRSAYNPVANVKTRYRVDRDELGVLRLYVEGVMVTKFNLGAEAIRDSSADITIGGADGSFFRELSFPGLIDEVRVTQLVARTGSDTGYVPSDNPFPDQSGIVTDIEGTAILSGGGELTASVLKNGFVDVVLAGNGVLSASTTRANSSTATLLGGGSISVSSFKSEVEEVDLIGGGTLSVSSHKNAVGTVAVTGNGNITVEGLVGSEVIAIIEGGGNLTAVGHKGEVEEATISGKGEIVLETSSQRFGSIAITGAGNIFVVTQKGALSSVEISGTGSITASGSKSVSRIATISAKGEIAASTQKEAIGALTLNGGGSITATGVVGKSLVVEGGGDITVSTQSGRIGSSVGTGGGEITAVVAKNETGTATITGGGVVSASVFKSEVEEAVISGGGSISGVIATQRSGSIVLSGGGEIDVDGAAAGTANIEIEGGGELVASGTKGAIKQSTLTQSGVLSVEAAKGAVGSTSLMGNGDVDCSIAKGGLTIITIASNGDISSTGQSGRIGRGTITANDNSSGTGSKAAFGILTGSGNGILTSLGVANRVGSVIISGAGLLVVDADKDPPGSFLSEANLTGTYSMTVRLTGTHDGRIIDLDGRVRR